MRRRALNQKLPLAFFSLLLPLGACGGEAVSVALDEPLRVQNAQFRKGDLPGVPPAETPINPYITLYTIDTQNVSQGQTDFPISGRASEDTWAVGLRFEGVGKGYWFFPVGDRDIDREEEFTWSAKIDFGREAAAGLKTMLLASFDRNGRAGTQTPIPFCLRSLVPDNRNACNPAQRPPAVVISLSWDSVADLDLRVFTPDGTLIESKRPTNAQPVDGGVPNPLPPGTGLLDRDSNRGCVHDGLRLENLVFNDLPPAGNYVVYANLFDACGTATTHLKVRVYSSEPGAEPDTFRQVKSIEQAGQLLAIDANGGSKLGMFVTQFKVQ